MSGGYLEGFAEEGAFGLKFHDRGERGDLFPEWLLVLQAGPALGGTVWARGHLWDVLRLDGGNCDSVPFFFFFLILVISRRF